MNELTARLGAVEPGLERVRALRANPAGRTFLAGLAVWLVAVVFTLVTNDANLLPTIIVVGSFLLPATYFVWAYHRADKGGLTLLVLLKAFVAGGALGVLSASALEAYFLTPSPFLYAGVALLEESAKLVVLVYVARGLGERTIRGGMVLGATVGFGFAAFQCVGYGLNAVFTVTGMSVRDLVETELLRGAIAPIGHGLWTAILGGVLFAATRNGGVRLTSSVLFAVLGTSALQAIWDAGHNVAVVFTLLLTGTTWQVRLLGLGYIPRPTEIQLHVFTLATFVGYVLIAAIGLLWSGILYRRADQLADADQRAEADRPAPAGGQRPAG